MTDGAALLRAILEAPADDAPRLIYADWLDEHGDAERAAFIRAMVRFKATQAYSLLRSYGASIDLEPVLTPALKNWLAGLAAAVGAARCDVWGGFVGRVELSLPAFRATAADLFAAHPVTRVRLTDRRPAPFPGGRWYWFFEAESPNGPHDLPSDLRPDGAGEFAVFRTEGDARAAASAWCVAHGRRLAGLPAL